MYEPYGIELIGSACYDMDNDDWACEVDFEPAERNCPDLDIDSEQHWGAVLEMLIIILKELVQELNCLPILSVEHITMGFSDGGLHIIK